MLRFTAVSIPLVAICILAGCASAPTQPQPQLSPNHVANVAAAGPNAVQLPSDMVATRHQPSNGAVRYVVKPGDTLWDISEYFLADPWLWPEVWYINPEISNPHLIYPGDVISLVWINGKPVLMRGDLPSAMSSDQRLSPRIRTTELDTPIPAIPLDAVRHFLRELRFLTAEDLATSPYVLAQSDDHLISARGQTFYARRFLQPLEERYLVVHPGQTYSDPETGEALGQEGIHTAEADMLVEGDPATLRIAKTHRETVPGDRLFPVPPAEFSDDIFLHIPEIQIEGRVAAQFDLHLRAGNYDVITINRGANHGVQNGTVFELFKNSDSAIDPLSGESITLPNEFSGSAVVFRTDARVAHALIMRSGRAVSVNDIIRTP